MSFSIGFNVATTGGTAHNSDQETSLEHAATGSFSLLDRLGLAARSVAPGEAAAGSPSTQGCAQNQSGTGHVSIDELIGHASGHRQHKPDMFLKETP
jgi:hypothetical protein